MDNNKIILALGVLVAMAIVGFVLLGQIGKAAVGWQQRRTAEVVQAVESIDDQITGMEDEVLEAAWARGDDVTADMIIQNQLAREEAKQHIQQQLHQARVDAGLAEPIPEPAPTGLLALGAEPKPDVADQMAMMPFIAAAGAGLVVGVLGLIGALIILRTDEVVELVEATQGQVNPEAVELELPVDAGSDPVTSEHTLNPRSQLKDAVQSLRQAEAQLLAVETHLEAAARSWLGSRVERVKALKAFQLAVLALADGGISVDAAMAARAEQWPTGRRSPEELREERDGVIALLGVVRFMIAQERR